MLSPNFNLKYLQAFLFSGPTVVRTNMLIRSMGPVSELDMDYSMDCYFRQSWRDSRLSFVGPIKSLSLSIKMLERIWRPDTYFYNGKHSYVHTITVRRLFLPLLILLRPPARITSGSPFYVIRSRSFSNVNYKKTPQEMINQ